MLYFDIYLILYLNVIKFRKNVELKAVENILISDVTVDILKSNSWQVIVTVFFDHFHEKNISLNEPIHIICTLENLYSNHREFSNLNVINNHANATVILHVPFVSMD
jgi:hypothetical protein